MHFKTAAFAALLATQAAALVLPRDDEVVVGGHGADGLDEAADLIAAYEESAPLIPEPEAAPIGTGSQFLPEDLEAVSEAAVADALSGGLSKRNVLELFKRGSCKAQPSKYTSGPDVSKKSRAQWEAVTTWRTTALGAPTPNAYYQVADWRSLNASAEASAYRGYMSLSSYDTAACAAKCNDIDGCSSFVIYFERNPTINLDRTNCPTSDAQTLIKCAFYGLALKASQATNDGQFTGGPDPKESNGDAFYTSIAGSNAYTTTPPPPTCFTAENLGVATIKAPAGQGSTYMSIQTFPGVSYNPQACADACNQKSLDNKKAAEKKNGVGADYRKCRFFDAYIAYKNDASPLFTCTYYTKSFDSSAATNIEQYNSAGDRFSHGSSVGYTLDETCGLETRKSEKFAAM